MVKPSLVLTGIGGIATALAFPLQPIPQLGPLCLWPLAFFGPAPYLARLLNNDSVTEAVKTSVVFGVCWILLSGVWVFRMFDALGWILIWLPIIAVVAFGAGANLLRRAGLCELWSWPLLWMVIEFVRGEWSPFRVNWLMESVDPLNFTWFGLGHPRCAWAPAAQSADLIGGYGLSLAPMLVSLLLAQAMTRRLRFWPSVLVLGLLAAEAGYCVRAWRSTFNGPMIHAGIIQSERFDQRVLMKLTEELLQASPETQLVVWPEESFAATDDDRAVLHQFARDRKITLVAGVETARPGGGHLNMAWWLPHNGEPDQYLKQQRVPFVEVHPSSGICRTFDLRADDRVIPVGILICYDVDFPWNPCRVVGECGAQLIVMPTLDDVTWGGTQHAQHALLPRLRAIENRRSLVQAATSGYSQIINPHGQVLAEIPFRMNMRPERSTIYREGFAVAAVSARTQLSLYTRIGRWVMPIAAVFTGCVIVFALFRNRRLPKGKDVPAIVSHIPPIGIRQ